MKYLISLAIIVRVLIPGQPMLSFEAERIQKVTKGFYEFRVNADKRVWTPVEYTIIEEK